MISEDTISLDKEPTLRKFVVQTQVNVGVCYRAENSAVSNFAAAQAFRSALTLEPGHEGAAFRYVFPVENDGSLINI